MKKTIIASGILTLVSTAAFADESAEKILASLRADTLLKYMECSWTAAAAGYRKDTLSRKAYEKEAEGLAKCTNGFEATVRAGVAKLRPFTANKPQAEAELKDFLATCLTLSRRIEIRPGFSEKPGAEVINMKLDRFETELSW